MIYIYDLILNWCRNRKYEFFEWKENDEVEYIKKMPVLKIKDFDNICNNDVKVGNDFLEKIYNKSEVYGSKKIEKVEYACIFCDEFLSKAIAIEFDMNGCSLYKSFIYFYDLDDVFDLAKKTDLLELDFSVIEINNDEDKYLTREEIDRKKLLINDINNSYKNNDIDKLKYFYYEIFGKEIDDINVIYNNLINSLNNEFNYKHNVIYEVANIPNF
jgi:hypothetical protein